MKLSEILCAVILIPKSGKHMLSIHHQLQHQSYDLLINNVYSSNPSKSSMTAIVKSYFWASRLLKDCTCLPRSIALYQHLTATAFEVEHKFGVNKQNQKLAAHAWVEFQCTPLNEAPDLKDRFVVLEKPKAGLAQRR